jgi:hypothetical protein
MTAGCKAGFQSATYSIVSLAEWISPWVCRFSGLAVAAGATAVLVTSGMGVFPWND